jgi:hypothetical protein
MPLCKIAEKGTKLSGTFQGEHGIVPQNCALDEVRFPSGIRTGVAGEE